MKDFPDDINIFNDVISGSRYYIMIFYVIGTLPLSSGLMAAGKAEQLRHEGLEPSTN